MNDDRTPYYRHHVFFCQNEREPGAPRPSCGPRGGIDAADYVKTRVKALGLAAPGKVRVNKAGCLDRCEEGPCVVVYPEGVWYTYVDRADLDEIVQQHLVGGCPVERLRLPSAPPQQAV
jgi:(2Fe-2S) ferredoxin